MIDTSVIETVLHRLRSVSDSNHLAPNDARLLSASIAQLELLRDTSNKNAPVRNHAVVMMTVMQVCELLWEVMQNAR